MKTATLETLREQFDDVEKWIAAGEEVTLTRSGVTVATLIAPPEPPPKPAGKPDWARWFREHPPVGRPLNKEETEAFYESLKRDF